jgi:hypothetical protein
MKVVGSVLSSVPAASVPDGQRSAQRAERPRFMAKHLCPAREVGIGHSLTVARFDRMPRVCPAHHGHG